MDLKFSGEFCIPGQTQKRIADDHIERYKFAAKFIKGKTVLDIACGVGYGSRTLAENGAKKVIGVDISKKAISFANKNYKLNNITFKADDLFNHKSKIKFDIVVCLETIEHIKNDNKAFNNLYNLLKKEGLLIISSPNRIVTSPNAIHINDKPLNKFHVREYTVYELAGKLMEHHFAVSPNNIFGQRPRPVFKYRILNSIYNIIFNPDMRSSPRVEKIGKFFEQRYIVMIAKK